MKVGAWYLGDDRCEFTVWCPRSKTVTLELSDRSVEMQRQDDGYWSTIVSGIKPGAEYRYRLQSGTFPDPASQFQPSGVHGASAVVDHRFEWQDSQWQGIKLEDFVIYELHVGAFTPEGTFEAIIPRLQTLKELGVSAIEIMPISQFPGDRNWGYDGTYPYAIQNSYGDANSLKKLVNACHQHGISVVLDVVYNHFGPEGAYINQFGDYFTETYKTPWGSALNFDNAYSHCVRSYFLENALYWLREFHIDALRLDAVQAIYDMGARHFLAELADRVEELSQQQNRKLYLIAESDLNDVKLIRSKSANGYGLDAQWSDDFHHALHALLTGTDIGYYQDFGTCEDLAKAYRNTFVYDWKYAPHRFRFHGAPALDCPMTQFVVCIQNHDQIGNQMHGERLSQLISFEGLKLAAGAVLLSPYIPLLFMGEEYGEEVPFTYFVSHSDPELIQAVRRGRKAEFAAFHLEGEPPDPEAPETFQVCKLQWERHQQGKHKVLWTFYQRLLKLRRSHPALVKRDRASVSACAEENKKLVWLERQDVICIFNFNQSDQVFEFPAGQWRILLNSADQEWMGAGSLAPEKGQEGESGTVRSQSFVVYERY
ncbi:MULTISPECIES: malto-oligosyltrehalose trehalohydrolase [Leptolyngbya]|uniref:malto-oligosyltrehalose trehalohydrolase n=1 Tax=Leptolyngbya TaxID=47251 RepID=UPI0016875504|nr:malto-oligosyltrehalose trehalohydrolase [Leptolyngbya sp. FACHB-1624]MBD1859900.1 malto-oligosyltrehalose trehalohydrolase [Leptolyngbya sp. FACHB-1624]